MPVPIGGERWIGVIFSPRTIRWFLQSTRKPKLSKKSAPRMGWIMSAIVKVQVSGWATEERVNFRVVVPKVGMVELFAVRRAPVEAVESAKDFGRIDRHEPVSMRKEILVQIFLCRWIEAGRVNRPQHRAPPVSTPLTGGVIGFLDKCNQGDNG